LACRSRRSRWSKATATSSASATDRRLAFDHGDRQAIVEASAIVVAKGKQAAAHLMEASEGDIEFADGRFTIAGTDRSIGIMELAQRVREGKLPEDAPRSLDVDHATKNTVDLPQWLPCRGSRNRSRNRRRGSRALFAVMILEPWSNR